MNVTNIVASLARQLRVATVAGSTLLPGVTVLSGGMAFVGDNASAATVILSEDFEDDGDDTWGGGANVFGTYASATDLSNSPHSGVPSGGQRYGHLINTVVIPSATLASVDGGPLVSALVDLTPGENTIEFDGWLAAWTFEGDHARFQAEFFSGLGGGGSSLGSLVLADGSRTTAADGVVAYVDSSGVVQPGDAGAEVFNWKHYLTNNPIPVGALSVAITYIGDSTSGSNGNDAYADNILIKTIPEPASIALIGLGATGLLVLSSRRK